MSHKPSQKQDELISVIIPAFNEEEFIDGTITALQRYAPEKAEIIIEKDKIIHLSNKDTQLFFDILENPPEPNTKLKNAVKNYRANIQ